MTYIILEKLFLETLYLTNVSRELYYGMTPITVDLNNCADMSKVSIFRFLIKRMLDELEKISNKVMNEIETIENPLEHPEDIDVDINNKIKNLIATKLSGGSLTFYEVMDYLEEKVLERDVKTSKIVAYYCVNIIINSKMSDSDKMELISNIKILIDDLE